MDNGNGQRSCSFCGKRQEQVRRIMSGPEAFICNECIELCNKVLKFDPSNATAKQFLDILK